MAGTSGLVAVSGNNTRCGSRFFAHLYASFPSLRSVCRCERTDRLLKEGERSVVRHPLLFCSTVEDAGTAFISPQVFWSPCLCVADFRSYSLWSRLSSKHGLDAALPSISSVPTSMLPFYNIPVVRAQLHRLWCMIALWRHRMQPRRSFGARTFTTA